MKIAAVLSVLLASSAFGAASLSVTPTDAVIDASRQVTLEFAVTPDGTDDINGLGIKVVAPGNSVRVVSRTATNPTLSDPLYASSVTSKLIESINDLGYASADYTVGTKVAGPLMTLVLAVEPSVEVSPAAPLTIQFIGTWADTDFNEGPAGTATVNIVPEPASMLLLAVGGAFFARRRRVA